MLVILMNTIVLSLDHYGITPQMDEDLEMINFVLSCIFLVEMAIKILGLGIKAYGRYDKISNTYG